jgi:Raf kinase inhibitor-like YbhB/YbcL family protein
MRHLLFLGLCAASILACSSNETAPPADDGGGGGTASSGGGGTGGSGGGAVTSTGGMAPFALTSTAFAEGETIPETHECGAGIGNGPGDNLSPPLSWTEGPPGTQSYAVVMHDLDFMNLTHWVIYDIPATTLSLPAGVPSGYQPPSPAGAKQAEIQGSGYFGYFGPCSPNSINTYQWTVHAMPTPTLEGVTMDSTEIQISTAVEATSIAAASLSGES